MVLALIAFPMHGWAGPCVEILKYVSVDSGDTWHDANTVDKAPRTANGAMYKLIVKNCHDAWDLNDVTITDHILGIEPVIIGSLTDEVPVELTSSTQGFKNLNQPDRCPGCDPAGPPGKVNIAMVTATASIDGGSVREAKDTDPAWVICEQPPPPPTGACCLPDGSCTDDVTSADCSTIPDATYQGDDTSCDVDCPLPPEPPFQCVERGPKIKKLVMEYTGDGCDENQQHTQDPRKVKCTGDPEDSTPVFIVAASKDNLDDSKTKIWFSGSVGVNGEFVIDATDAGKTKLDADTHVFIESEGGTRLQYIKFHTSCSQPLVTGNQFGSLKLVAGEFE